MVGKPVHIAFDGGRLTSGTGTMLLAAVEKRPGIAERLAKVCPRRMATAPAKRRSDRHWRERAVARRATLG
jgi:hypothetical protein